MDLFWGNWNFTWNSHIPWKKNMENQWKCMVSYVSCSFSLQPIPWIQPTQLSKAMPRLTISISSHNLRRRNSSAQLSSTDSTGPGAGWPWIGGNMRLYEIHVAWNEMKCLATLRKKVAHGPNVSWMQVDLETYGSIKSNGAVTSGYHFVPDKQHSSICFEPQGPLRVNHFGKFGSAQFVSAWLAKWWDPRGWNNHGLWSSSQLINFFKFQQIDPRLELVLQYAAVLQQTMQREVVKALFRLTTRPLTLSFLQGSCKIVSYRIMIHCLSSLWARCRYSSRIRIQAACCKHKYLCRHRKAPFPLFFGTARRKTLAEKETCACKQRGPKPYWNRLSCIYNTFDSRQWRRWNHLLWCPASRRLQILHGFHWPMLASKRACVKHAHSNPL